MRKEGIKSFEVFVMEDIVKSEESLQKRVSWMDSRQNEEIGLLKMMGIKSNTNNPKLTEETVGPHNEEGTSF